MYLQGVNILLQGLDRCVLTVGREQYQFPTAILEPFTGTIPPVMNLLGWQNHSEKADQLTMHSCLV